jgi:hypothetical protein
MPLREDRGMKLSESEEKYILRLKRNEGKTYIGYISIGLSWAASFVGFLFGVLSGRKDSFLAMVFFAWLGITLLLVIRSHRMVYGIITKLQSHIRELERNGQK